MHKINYELSLECADSIKESEGKISAILADVDSAISNVGNEEVWSGTSANDYVAKYKDISSKYQEFIGKVRDYYNFIYRAVDMYEDAERKKQEYDEGLPH